MSAAAPARSSHPHHVYSRILFSFNCRFAAGHSLHDGTTGLEKQAMSCTKKGLEIGEEGCEAMKKKR